MSERQRVPASAIQRQFWLTQTMAPESAAYNIPCGFVFDGEVDAERFRRSVLAIVADEAVLRSTYEFADGALNQVITDTASVEFVEESLLGGDRDAFVEAAKRRMNVHASRPFDLAKGPVVRLVWLSSEVATRSAALIVIHHIAVDLHSKDLLGRKIERRYAAENPTAYAEPDRAPSYAELSEWQREWLASDEAKAQTRFWCERLAGRTLALPLHTNRRPQTAPSFHGDLVPFRLGRQLADRVRHFSREQALDPFVVLLAAYYATLNKYTREADFVIGVPLSNRRKSSFKDVVGCFVNTVPLTVDIDVAAGFAALARGVRTAMLGAHRNQELPIEHVVTALAPAREAGRNPIYQVGFTFEHLMSLALPGVVVEPVACNTAGAQLELFLRFLSSAGEIEGHLEYATDLFEPDSARRFVENYKALLAAGLSAPEKSLATLDALSKADDELLRHWNDNARPYELLTLTAAFERQADRTPDALALWLGDERLTYRDLDERANQIAHHLVQRGVGPGQRVAVCMNRSVDMLVAIYGVLKAGAAYVPIEPEYPEGRLRYMLGNIEPACVLATAATAAKLGQVSAPLVIVDAEPALASELRSRFPLRASLSDAAYVIYTSGSTGNPKGVINHHAGVANRLCWMQEAFGLVAGELVLFKTPFSFDVSVWELFWPLQVGATLAIAPAGEHRDPAALSRTMSRTAVSTIHFVPSMLEAFLSFDWGDPLPALRRVICSGEDLSRDLQDRFHARFPGVELHNLYGPTEAAVDVTHWPCRPEDPRPFVPIGRAIANTQMYVLDNGLRRVPIGVPGEICIGGVQVALGYWNNQALTREKFVDDPFQPAGAKLYRTGDLGVFLPDGALRYLGRLDFQVKLRGNRVEIGEIEARLRSHPAVREAAVVARSIGNQLSLVAYFTGEKDCQADELRRHCAEQLPDYMVPSFVVFLSAMPLTSSGKLDRKALPEPNISQLLADHPRVLPSSELEVEIAALWCELLGVDEVGIHDNFMDIGGNSLLLTRLSAELRPRFGDKVSLVALLQHTTIAKLAQSLGQGEEVGGASALAKSAAQSRAAKGKAALAQHKLKRT